MADFNNFIGEKTRTNKWKNQKANFEKMNDKKPYDSQFFYDYHDTPKTEESKKDPRDNSSEFFYTTLRKMLLDASWSKESELFGQNVEAEEYISEQFSVMNQEIIELLKNDPEQLANHILTYNHIRYTFIPNIMGQIREKLSPETFGIRHYKEREVLISNMFRLIDRIHDNPDLFQDSEWIKEAENLLIRLERLSDKTEGKPFSEQELKFTENNIDSIMTSILPQIETELTKINFSPKQEVQLITPNPQQEEEIHDFLATEYLCNIIHEFYIAERDLPYDEKDEQYKNESISSRFGMSKVLNAAMYGIGGAGVAGAVYGLSQIAAPIFILMQNTLCQSLLSVDSLMEWIKYIQELNRSIDLVSKSSTNFPKKTYIIFKNILYRIISQIAEDFGMEVGEMKNAVNTVFRDDPLLFNTIVKDPVNWFLEFLRIKKKSGEQIPKNKTRAAILSLKLIASIYISFSIFLLPFTEIISYGNNVDLNPTSQKIDEYVNDSIYKFELGDYTTNLTASEAIYKAHVKKICDSFISNDTKTVQFEDLIKIIQKNGTADELIYAGYMTDRYVNDNSGTIINMAKSLNINCSLPGINETSMLPTPIKLAEKQLQSDISDTEKILNNHVLRNGTKFALNNELLKESENLKSDLVGLYNIVIQTEIKKINNVEEKHLYESKRQILNHIVIFYHEFNSKILSKTPEKSTLDDVQSKLVSLVRFIQDNDPQIYKHLISSNKHLSFLNDPSYKFQTLFGEYDENNNGYELVQNFVNKVYKTYVDEFFTKSDYAAAKLKATKMINIFNNNLKFYEVWVKKTTEKDAVINLMKTLCIDIEKLNERGKKNIQNMKEKVVLETIGNSVLKSDNPLSSIYRAWTKNMESVGGLTKHVVCSNLTSELYELLPPNTYIDWLLGYVRPVTEQFVGKSLPTTNQMYFAVLKQMDYYFGHLKIISILNTLKSHLDLVFMARYAQLVSQVGHLMERISNYLSSFIKPKPPAKYEEEDVTIKSDQNTDPIKLESNKTCESAKKHINNVNNNRPIWSSLINICKTGTVSVSGEFGRLLKIFGVFSLKTTLIYSFNMILKAIPSYILTTCGILFGVFFTLFIFRVKYLPENNEDNNTGWNSKVRNWGKMLAMMGGLFILTTTGPIFVLYNSLTTFVFGLMILGTSKQLMANFRDCNSISSVLLYMHGGLVGMFNTGYTDMASIISANIPDFSRRGIMNAIYNIVSDPQQALTSLLGCLLDIFHFAYSFADLIIFVKVLKEQMYGSGNGDDYFKFIYSNEVWNNSTIPTTVEDSLFGKNIKDFIKELKIERLKQISEEENYQDE